VARKLKASSRYVGVWKDPSRVERPWARPASAEELTNEVLRAFKRRTTSRFVGVSYNGFAFTATVSVANRTMYLGSFATEEEAAAARDRAATRLHGNRARFNFDPETGEEHIGRRKPSGGR